MPFGNNNSYNTAMPYGAYPQQPIMPYGGQAMMPAMPVMPVAPIAVPVMPQAVAPAVRLADRVDGRFRKPFIALDEPIECVRVDERSHGMYSAKSSRCSSSSEIIVIIPFPSPGTRRLRSAAAFVETVAIGLSFSMMIISSPGPSCEISSLSFLCASSTETVNVMVQPSCVSVC